MNPLDARFVDAEDTDPHTSMAIASVAVFEGPAPSYDEFVAAIEGRLPLVPLYRRKLRSVPGRLGSPVWVDDEHFDLRYHIRLTALPEPGGDIELSRLTARVMAQRLDRDRPLWEYWLVHGLADGHWALVSKVHHCMVDGVSGTDLYRVIFDLTPEPPSPLPPPPAPGPEPSDLRLFLGAAVDTALLPVREARAALGALRSPRDAARHGADMVRGTARILGAMLPARRSSLSGPIGTPRRFAFVRASLDDVRSVKAAFGGTVNDVVLAAISAGFRQLLLARGERPEPHMVPSLVPVSVRAPGEEGIYENRVSAIVADLPVEIADPVERLAAVRTRLSDLKESGEATAFQAGVALLRYVPFPVAALAGHAAFAYRQREIVTVTTNVPGPRQPLYGLGRRLVEIIPYVPISTSVRIGIAIFTYCDQVTFGLTGDYDSAPDLDVLAAAIGAGVTELVKAAGGAAGAAGAAASAASQ